MQPVPKSLDQIVVCRDQAGRPTTFAQRKAQADKAGQKGRFDEASYLRETVTAHQQLHHCNDPERVLGDHRIGDSSELHLRALVKSSIQKSLNDHWDSVKQSIKDITWAIGVVAVLGGVVYVGISLDK